METTRIYPNATTLKEMVQELEANGTCNAIGRILFYPDCVAVEYNAEPLAFVLNK